MKQRNTLQKEATYKALASFHGHPTAEDIYAKVHEEYPPYIESDNLQESHDS